MLKKTKFLYLQQGTTWVSVRPTRLPRTCRRNKSSWRGVYMARVQRLGLETSSSPSIRSSGACTQSNRRSGDWSRSDTPAPRTCSKRKGRWLAAPGSGNARSRWGTWELWRGWSWSTASTRQVPTGERSRSPRGGRCCSRRAYRSWGLSLRWLWGSRCSCCRRGSGGLVDRRIWPACWQQLQQRLRLLLHTAGSSWADGCCWES